MVNPLIDINCDLGEGLIDDAVLMPYIDTCNIACGGHAGDEDSMARTLSLSKQFGVNAGAHPSFEDRVNFGRKVLEVPVKGLKSQLTAQVATLLEIADRQEVAVSHVKAHGALYNLSAEDYDMARLLIEVVTSFKEDLCIFVPYGSLLEAIVKKENLTYKVEVFADRNYSDGLKLLPRSHSDSVLNEPEQIKERVWRMLTEKKVLTHSEQEVAIDFDTICVHGDHPKALEICKALNELKTRRI